jgi:hypothetical protein
MTIKDVIFYSVGGLMLAIFLFRYIALLLRVRKKMNLGLSWLKIKLKRKYLIIVLFALTVVVSTYFAIIAWCDFSISSENFVRMNDENKIYLLGSDEEGNVHIARGKIKKIRVDSWDVSNDYGIISASDWRKGYSYYYDQSNRLISVTNNKSSPIENRYNQESRTEREYSEKGFILRVCSGILAN